MVSDMNIFVWNCLKSQRKKKVFFSHFFTFEVPFNGLFAPTSQSRMSNIFRDLESLGKRNGKKWSNIWTFLFGSGLKWPCKKKFFLLLLILLWSTILWHWCYYPHRSRDALSPVCGIFFFAFLESLGKFRNCHGALLKNWIYIWQKFNVLCLVGQICPSLARIGLRSKVSKGYLKVQGIQKVP